MLETQSRMMGDPNVSEMGGFDDDSVMKPINQ